MKNVYNRLCLLNYTNMNAADCYNLSNDVSKNVRYNNRKLYYTIPSSYDALLASSFRNKKVGCLQMEPAGYIGQNDQTTTNETFRVGQLGECDDTDFKMFRNNPTSVILTDNGHMMGSNSQCLVYNVNGNALEVATQVPILDFVRSMKWYWDGDHIAHNQYTCLGVDDNNNLVAEFCDSDKMRQKWKQEGMEIRNISKDQCIDVVNKRVTTCTGGVTSNKWDYKDGLLQNSLTGKCLDGNGVSVYTGSCDSNNGYQKWDILNGGAKLKHRLSGKCVGITFDASGPHLQFQACECDSTMVSPVDYSNYIKSKTTDCSSISNWGYDGNPECVNFIYDNDILMDKFIKWCDSNQKNGAINKYCIEAVKSSNLLSFYSKSCNTGDDILNKNVCTAMLDTPDLLLDNKSKEYIRIKYDDALEQYCDARMTVNQGDVPKLVRKYTTDWSDPDCIGNWTYKYSDGTTTKIKLATNLEDTSYWCILSKGDSDPLKKCYIPSGNASIYTSDYYKSYNTIWRNTGAYRDLPIRLFKKFNIKFKTSDNIQTDLSSYIQTTYKPTGSIPHVADVLIFYGGYPLLTSNRMLVSSPKCYCENGNYKIYFTNGTVVREAVKDQLLSGDVMVSTSSNLLDNSQYTIVNNNGDIFTIDNSGVPRKHTLVVKSSFSGERESLSDDSSVFVWFLLIVFIVLLGICIHKYKKWFSKKQRSQELLL